MGLHRTPKGLTLPIGGAPRQALGDEKPVTQVAIVADDFPGMKPRFLVREGDRVKRGQPVFDDRRLDGVVHTAPAAGRVVAIHRGERRALQSVVIELSEGERAGRAEHHAFVSHLAKAARDYSASEARALLIESGAWTHLRTRPFGHTPDVGQKAAAVFVNGMDSSPLAVDPDVAAAGQREALDAGLTLLSKLTEGKTYFCVAAGSKLAQGLSAPVTVEEFAGPHPSGTTGFHIHTLLPAHRERVLFTTTYQEAIAIGHLVLSGQVYVERIVALCGPAARDPRLIKTRTGAAIRELLAGELNTDKEVRAISGSVLSGAAATDVPFAYLGRRDTQVSLIEEASERRFLGWLGLGLDRYSILPTFLSKWVGKKTFPWTTDTHGSPRAMVPIGMYERVNAWDILPTHLLRALLVGDVEMAEKLGALELDEEDVALFSFVCPQKTNFGLVLRANLERMFAEG